MKVEMIAAVVVAALAMAGCGGDDDDYTATAQNCQVVEYGEGEQYKLCCTVTCYYHYDNDHYSEQCSEARSCVPVAPTTGDCPQPVIDENDYPRCPYY
jgi:hypothetical protein